MSKLSIAHALIILTLFSGLEGQEESSQDSIKLRWGILSTAAFGHVFLNALKKCTT